MRSATTLDTWLAEYDHVVTEAELYGVSEVINIDEIIEHFLPAVNKVATIWSI